MSLLERISTALGQDIAELQAIGGGSLSEVYSATLTDGRAVIAKQAAGAHLEAEMLRAISASGCPAPDVIFAADDLLIMTRLEEGARPDAAAWAEAGASISQMHSAAGPYGYGWRADHAFGAVAIPNDTTETWPDFWAMKRLLAAPDTLPQPIRHRVETLCQTINDRLPRDPRPTLLHGDLWSGNVLFGPKGFSGVIDPAAYYGDAEVDLAMLTLFGRLPPAFFEGYGALGPGSDERRPIYQLWPALVHLRLFGTSYKQMVEGLLDATGV